MYYYKVAESGTQHKPSFPQDQGLSCCPHSQQHSYEDISDHSSVKRTVASNFDIFFLNDGKMHKWVFISIILST